MNTLHTEYPTSMMMCVVEMLQEKYYFNSTEPLNRQQLLRFYFDAGHCPQCGNTVTTVNHEGFCSDQHYRHFMQKYVHLNIAYQAECALARYEQNTWDELFRRFASYVHDMIQRRIPFAELKNLQVPVYGGQHAIALTPRINSVTPLLMHAQ
jgi:N-acetyl-beta-hexosaminidase